MLDRSTSAAARKRHRRRRRTAAEREQHRIAEAQRRARERKHVKLYLIRAGEIVHEALTARNIDASMSEERAGREARNRAKVKRDLEHIVLHWARWYLAKRRAT